ncbi:SdrD B-like domain-containing protein [Persicitalea jodogahamensis]|uniref:SdrD B-like domain-containing protein n=1 Tax=Persicitalea jodogahamensis TaxID=402147 RepID=UPI001678CD8A|nr:SdrD B-like domain-containing protein [Persicitalea jodogahamensis]
MNHPLLPEKLTQLIGMTIATFVSAISSFFSRASLGHKNLSVTARPALLRQVAEKAFDGKLRARTVAFVALFFLSLGTTWAQVDLSLSKNIDKSKPAIGDVVTYTITVKNSGILEATGVMIKDSLPLGGVSYLSSTLVRGGTSYTSATGMWNVGTVAPGDSAILTISATVLAQGVFFNVAEVFSMNEDDMDSWPNDGALDQDDLASTCFSVPIDYYAGDEFDVSVPSGYKGVVWSYNGIAITDSVMVDGKVRARVNPDSTLTIMGPGSYTFISTVGVSCPATGCCAIEIVDGPIFDLALRKNLAPGQASLVMPGDIVNFRLYIKNEGNTPATQIALTDSLPAGLSIAPGETAWTANGSGNILTLNTPIPGPLAPGDSVFVDVSVQVSGSFTGSSLTNYAQIQDAKNGEGNDVTDQDSTPGNGFNNGEDDADDEPINVSPTPYGSIGDLVFYDSNNNGVQDGGEPGINGVKVVLQDQNMVAIDSMITAGGGQYLFDSLASGQYFVKFFAPGDSVFVSPNQGGDPTKDSNAGESGTPGKTNVITIDTTKPSNDTLRNNPNIDAGIYRAPIFDLTLRKTLASNQPTTVLPGDTVTFSITVKNEGEIAATQIALSDSLPAGLTSIDAGWPQVGAIATRTELIPGPLAPGDSITVDIETKVETTFTSGILLNYAQIKDAKDQNGNPVIDKDSTPGNGSNNGEDDAASASVNVSLTPYGSIGDFVFFDTNNNGVQDDGEPGINGVKVQLQDENMVAIDSMITANGGKYLFDSLPTGTYFVKFFALSGQTFITPNVGGDPAKDSNAGESGTPGKTNGITINTSLPVNDIGRNNLTIDAGFNKIITPYGSIGDFVWLDTNNNGVQDANELTGVDGLTVELQDSAMIPIKTTVTKNGGKYLFDSLASGTYFVRFIAGPNQTLVQPKQGSDPTKDSDAGASGVPGKTKAITIDTTKPIDDTLRNNPNIDAGIAPQCPTITLTVSPDQEICVGEAVVLGATSNVQVVTIKWYYAAVGGTAFATTTSGLDLNLSPTSTTTYYLQAMTDQGCMSDRTPITVVVNAKPATPTCISNITNICPDSTVDLTAITISPISIVGGVFEWRVGPSTTSALVTDPTKVKGGKYYLFEKSPAGCYSNPAVIVVNIVSCDCQLVYNVNAGADQEVCAGSSVSVTATLTGSAAGITWTTTGTGTFASANSLTTTYTPSAADIADGSVVLSATTDDPDGNGTCVPKMDALSVVINPMPAPAFGVACDDTLVCLGKSTKLIGFAPGATIKWYLAEQGGTAIGSTPSGGKLVVTPSATTTYYAETVSDKGCVSAERTPVTVVVKPCFSDLAVVKTILTPGPYTPGQEINYSVTVQNLGIGNAKSVTVKDIFPSSLAYVSSAPVGEYNSGSGIWTIGDLTNGSNRVLIMTAKIKDSAAGSITNTAIVRSADNDPGKTTNDTSSVTIKVDNIADLMLAKKASKVNPVTGETITYTLEVTNDGPQKATNVEVTDQLPAGLEFVSSTDFSKTGNILKGIVASIGVGETKSLTFEAKVTGAGAIKNVAQISKSDQKDPDSTPGDGYTNGQDDEASVTVNVGCPTIEPPIIACAETNVCVGTSIKLTSVGCKNGTVKWSNGMTGASIMATVNETTTFTAVCEVGECQSAPSNPITIKVAAPVKPVLASNVSEVCIGGSATLTASNCNGVVVWSTGATGSPLVVTPTETTTYTAYCKKSECVSESASITIKIGQPGPPPVITCGKMEICPGESVTLTAYECAGTVKWSNGTTGTSITVSPAATTTYSAKCVTGTCESEESEKHTIKVTTPQAPVIASSNLTICPGGTATLTATGCDGTVKWSNGQTGSSIVVTLNATKSFTATCKTDACESSESNMVTIKVAAPTAPIIASDKTVVCAGDSVTLTATGCTATTTWSNGMAGASIKVAPTATTVYSAVCKVDDCASDASNKVTINVNTAGTPPVIAASKPDICAGEEVTLTATGCTGVVKWSNGTEGASIKVNPTTTTSYTAICKITAATCASGPSNTVTIKVGTPVAPVLTASKLTICQGEEVTLTATGCTGTVKWDNGMTGASIKVSPTAATTYGATCDKGVCVSEKATIKIDVTTTPPPTVICSTDSICKGESVTLIIQGCEGTAKWSTGQTGEAIVVSPMVTTSYTASCVVNGCESASSIQYKINVVEPVKPVLTASKNPIAPGESTTITATGCNGSLEWSNGSAESSITVSPAVTTTYSVICLVKECASDTAKLTIEVKDCKVEAPVISASSPTVCVGSNVTLTATGCANTVVWSNGQTGPSITVALSTTTTFTATCKLDEECMSLVSNAVTVSVTRLEAPTLTVSSNRICAGDSVKLTAIGCQGEVMWSNGATGASIYVKPTATTSYSATCKLGTCESSPSASATISVGKPGTPTISASTNSICFGTPVTLTASGCSEGYVIWSNGLVGNSITISPAATTTFTAQCCTSTFCKSDPSTPVTVTVGQKVVKPLTQNLTNVCPFNTVDLTTGVTSSPKSAGGVFVYRTGSSPESAAVADPAKVGAGTYYVFEKATTGCFSGASVIIVTITNCDNTTPCETNPATADAGADATICAATTYKLAGSIGGAAASGMWTTSGTGTFDNPGLLTATYTPSLADLQSGEVTLTLTTNDPDGPNGNCVAASDQVKLTLESIKIQPGIAINGVAKTDTMATTLSICAGDSVTITATDVLDSGAYTYKLNGGAASANNTFVVKSSGTYSVTLMNEAGCSSMASARVIVNVTAPMMTPVVSNKRNTCPSTTVDLTTAVMGQPSNGNSYIYRIGTSPTSDVVASPTMVGAGTYYVFEKSAEGCFSTPSKVEVGIIDCSIDTDSTDLEIIKTVDKLTVAKGGEATYSIKIKNNGPIDATNITVIDILPEGLKYIAGAGYDIDGNVIKGVIPKIAANDSLVFTCLVDVIGEGTITNVAQIANLDQRDYNSANNKSAVDLIATAAPLAHENSIGVAKQAGDPVVITPGVYDVPYTIMVKNLGSNDLTKVQVIDDLSLTFGNGAKIVDGSIKVEADSGFVVNTAYTGEGANTGLLVDSLSTLPVGTMRDIYLTVRVDVTAATTSTFNNVALGSAMGAENVMVADSSTAGSNPDPDEDMDPTNDSEVTPIVLNNIPGESFIGVALSVKDTVRQSNGTYNITYQVVVKNFGSSVLTNVQITDSLSKVFNTQTGATFTKVGTPIASDISELAINQSFDGLNDMELLVSPNSRLNAGASDTLLFTINVQTDGRTEPYLNWVYASAKSGEKTVTDKSTNGVLADLNGNGDPTEALEDLGTPLVIPGGTELFIPEGFSPNGDGINDVFVIRNVPAGKRVTLEIYNRWMTQVFKDDDYKNDWTGISNNGLRVGNTAQGLPDGTYFYVVKIEDGKQYVRYMTITR